MRNMALHESLARIGNSLRELEKICVERENDVKTRQQDLFGGSKPQGKGIDTTAITAVVDRTIERIEKMLGAKG